MSSPVLNQALSLSPSTITLAGIDIGGTKCAINIGRVIDGHPEVIAKQRFPTPPTPTEAMSQFMAILDQFHHEYAPQAIGVSCGSPMDSKRGIVLAPPNLPTWDHIDVVTPFRERYGVPTALQNDANAGAMAEWMWGAGQGLENIVFLTFGTGMGAGLILNNQIYAGTNGLAGEVGHTRLAPDGPVGYGKAGSFEGFCSGGGIAQLARSMAEEAIRNGQPPTYCQTLADLPQVTTEIVGYAAQAGDPLAIHVWEIVAEKLGRGLAVIIDIINPQRIIIGSIFGRQRALLEPIMVKTLQAEALSYSLAVCDIVPAGLGESIGDFASLSIALDVLKHSR